MQVTYSTYTEDDYDAIWKHYSYQGNRQDWFYKVRLQQINSFADTERSMDQWGASDGEVDSLAPRAAIFLYSCHLQLC